VNKVPLGADLVIPALAAAFAVYFFFSIAGLAWEAKANGVVIGAVLLALIAIQGARVGVRLYRREADLGARPLWQPREVFARRLGLVAIAALFIATLEWLGLGLGMALAMSAALRVSGVRSRAALVLIPILVSAALYLLFIVVLQSEFPRGPLGRLAP
jgi:hypothetical protein